MGTRSFVAGVGVGAGLMYYFDPVHGDVRRARLAARVHEVWAELEGVADDEPAAASSLAPAIGSAAVLAGGPPAAPPVAPAIVTRRADDLPGLELAHQRGDRGGGAAPGVSATLAGVVGGALAAYGLLRRGVTGRALRLAGVGLLGYGLRRTDRAAVRTGERRRAVDVQQRLEVAAPVEGVFALLARPATFARVLAHVSEVRELGGGRARWRAEGPGGRELEWVTALTELVPNHLVAWRSEPGGDLAQSGIVRLAPTDGGTRIDLRLCYAPGATDAAALFGPDPRRELTADLERLRALLEAEGGDHRGTERAGDGMGGAGAGAASGREARR
ncbi:MAG TPA: SRPBCC family protein [Gemmatimonadales bacterium]|nr:SRPBCC family protein [Gemmatimonadales bacterium]